MIRTLFAGLALLTFAPAVRAQPFSCTESAVPPLVRAEGLTELAGDIVLDCTGGTPTPAGQSIPQANLSVFLNTAVTSRLLQGSSSASEALLLIDDPGAGANTSPQLVCASTNGCAVNGTSTTAGVAGPEPFNGTSGRPNIFQGLISGTSLTFLGVPIDPPGNGHRVFRITNIRVNASAVVPGASGGPGQVVASFAASGSSVPVSNAVQNVALTQAGATFSVRDGANASALNNGFTMQQGNTQSPGGVPSAVLRFTENFATALRTRTSAAPAGADTSPAPSNQNVPGATYNSESGFTFAFGNETAGLAGSGSRLRTVFNGIPAGVRIFAGVANTGGSTTRRARLTASESGAFSAVAATDTTNFGSFAVAEIPVVNGSAAATWEVLASDPLSRSNYDFPVWFTGTPAAAGTATVNGNLAPAPPAFSAADGARAEGSSFPIPRFADTSTAQNVLVVAPTSTSSVLSPNPASLTFNVPAGATAAAAQTIALSANGAAANLSVVAIANGGSWLSVTPTNSVTPSTLTVSANPAGLAAGIYFGSVILNSGGAANSPLAIPVTLIVSAAPIPSVNSQTLSHIADGAGWKTQVILLNMGSTQANFTLRFWDESGNPWRLPLGADGFQTQVGGSIPVGGSRTIQTDGIASFLAVGSAELLTTAGSIGGTAVFALQIPGQPDTEAAVPITTIRGRRFLLPFDSTPGFATGVAIANPNPVQNAVVSVIFRNQAGQITSSVGPYNVLAHGHVSFVIPASAGTLGVAEFSSPNVDVTGLGIRSHGRAFTSVETLCGVPAGGKTISHIADGGGWKTTIVLVNSDSQPAPFTIRFRQDNGSTLTLSLGADGRVSRLTGTIAPGGSRIIRTDGSAVTLATGWAELTTTFAVGGTAIFGAQVPGQPDSEAAVPIIAGVGNHFFLPYDGSSGFGTGVAFANPSTTVNAGISVILRDVFGQQIGAQQAYSAPASGHSSAVLPVSGRGVAEIFSPNTPVSALGIRSHNGAFTSVRSLVILPGLDDVVSGVKQIVSGGSSGPVSATTSGDWVTLASGDDDTTNPSSFAMARTFGQGRIAAAGHEGLLINAQLKDNSLFVPNLITWLDSAVQRKVAYSTGHSEFFNSSNAGPLKTALTNRGFTLTNLTGRITTSALSAYSVLIIGNGWDSFTGAEIQAVQDFVTGGGGLLMAGIGWSWLPNNSSKTMDDYPMLKMALPYGLTWPSVVILDPDASDQLDGSTIFHTFYPNARP